MNRKMQERRQKEAKGKRDGNQHTVQPSISHGTRTLSQVENYRPFQLKVKIKRHTEKIGRTIIVNKKEQPDANDATKPPKQNQLVNKIALNFVNKVDLTNPNFHILQRKHSAVEHQPAFDVQLDPTPGVTLNGRKAAPLQPQ